MNTDARAPCISRMVQFAFDRRLAIFVGAGVSVGAPSRVPSSTELVELLAPEIRADLGIEALRDDGSPRGLEEVGDEAAGRGTLETLRHLAARNPAFDTEAK